MADAKYVSSGATISADGRYRYRLWREWRLHPAPAQWDMWTDNGKPVVDGAGEQLGTPKSCVFIMLNPSTADGDTDDPTIRRCVGFAKALGYDRLDVLNLFAHRATDPAELLALNWDDDPIGPNNRSHVASVMQGECRPGHIICAWGSHGGHLGQDEEMLGWLGSRKAHALRLTKDGHPAHPLYLPANCQPIPFNGRGRPV